MGIVGSKKSSGHSGVQMFGLQKSKVEIQNFLKVHTRSDSKNLHDTKEHKRSASKNLGLVTEKFSGYSRTLSHPTFQKVHKCSSSKKSSGHSRTLRCTNIQAKKVLT